MEEAQDSSLHSRDKEYIDTQLSMISKILGNAIRHVSSIEVKNLVEYTEKMINNMGEGSTELPDAIKETTRKVVKFLTTDQMKQLIKFVESKSDSELEKVVNDLLNLNYKILEGTYNGFLEFVMNNMHKKDQPIE